MGWALPPCDQHHKPDNQRSNPDLNDGVSVEWPEHAASPRGIPFLHGSPRAGRPGLRLTAAIPQTGLDRAGYT
jgi:hypothetical protein